ncbi:MAG TPA: ABC transporter permease [Clostridia bacterium]|nr:ABC transporter permease [Clostridia bacterium]
MKPLAIAWTNVIRLFRDRQGLFFVFALPIVIIVVFGLAFGGQASSTLGVADEDGGPFGRELVTMLEPSGDGVVLRTFGSAAALRDAVQRNQVDLGVAIPAGYSAALAEGRTASVEVVARPGETISIALRPLIDDVVHRQAAVLTAARYAMAERGIGFEEALADARGQAAAIGAVEVRTETTAETLIEPGMSGYLMGAQSQLVMFIFMISMTAATQLIVTRQLGISRRMYASPTSARSIILGEGLGRFAVAMLQGLFIFVTTALIFGVSWGDPVAATLVVVAFALVATGAAMLVGSVATNPEQASSMGVGLSMLLAAFGGAMVPPEVFPEIMRTASHVTPHAWAIDAFRALTLRDETIAGILPQLAVLAGFAAVLLGLATVRFRRAIAG